MSIFQDILKFQSRFNFNIFFEYRILFTLISFLCIYFDLVTFTQYSQPTSVLTPASPLTQGMTHPNTRPDIGILASRSGHFNSEPLYGTIQQQPQSAAYGSPVRFVELSRNNAVLPVITHFFYSFFKYFYYLHLIILLKLVYTKE